MCLRSEFCRDRRKFESDYQKTNPVGGASRSGFNRWFDVSRPPSGDQFPANLLASGIVRISQLSKTSMVFRKYFFSSLKPGSDIGGPPLGTLLESAFQGVNKKVRKNAAGENSFPQALRAGEKGSKNTRSGRGVLSKTAPVWRRVRGGGVAGDAPGQSCPGSRVSSNFRQTLFTCGRRDGLMGWYGIQIL